MMRYSEIVGFLLCCGIGSAVGQELATGEAIVAVEPKVARGSSDVSAARIIDRATGTSLDGNLHVSFADGKTRLNPGSLENIEWERSGSSIVGRLRGANEEELAVLNGTVEEGAVAGTFRDIVGRTGTWRWTGEFPPER